MDIQTYLTSGPIDLLKTNQPQVFNTMSNGSPFLVKKRRKPQQKYILFENSNIKPFEFPDKDDQEWDNFNVTTRPIVESVLTSDMNFQTLRDSRLENIKNYGTKVQLTGKTFNKLFEHEILDETDVDYQIEGRPQRRKKVSSLINFMTSQQIMDSIKQDNILGKLQNIDKRIESGIKLSEVVNRAHKKANVINNNVMNIIGFITPIQKGRTQMQKLADDLNQLENEKDAVEQKFIDETDQKEKQLIGNQLNKLKDSISIQQNALIKNQQLLKQNIDELKKLEDDEKDIADIIPLIIDDKIDVKKINYSDIKKDPIKSLLLIYAMINKMGKKGVNFRTRHNAHDSIYFTFKDLVGNIVKIPKVISPAKAVALIESIQNTQLPGAKGDSLKGLYIDFDNATFKLPSTKEFALDEIDLILPQ